MSDQTEIRLLGRLWIRLGNGTVVPSSEWATGKTGDLLRLLAMQSEQNVSSASLIDKLWPDVPEAKALACLHTATVQIRKVLGKNSIMRHLSGVELKDCWVDIVAHQQLAADISVAIQSREYADVVTFAKQAEALYVDDFHADDDDSGWAGNIRDELRTQRKQMLVDAADSAIELGWMRDAIDMSTLAISLDSCFEPAHRSLMRAYAGIGEIHSAMRSYERCRRNLMTDLAARPSLQTEALYLQLAERAEDSATLLSPDLVSVAAPDSGRQGGHLRSVAVGNTPSAEALTSTMRPAAAATFRVIAEQLEPFELEICQVMTVLDRPATAIDVMELLGSGRQTESRRREIDSRMDQLASRGLFRADDDGYAFRDRTTHRLFELWMRPSLRALITERINEQGTVLLQSG